jgi:hypothetical protein
MRNGSGSDHNNMLLRDSRGPHAPRPRTTHEAYFRAVTKPDLPYSTHSSRVSLLPCEMTI